MKKLLIMSVLAALAFGAKADISYQVDVTKIEDGGVIAGTIPSTVKLMLVDVGSRTSTGMDTIYSTKINFTDASWGIDEKYFVERDGYTRFDVQSFMRDRSYEKYTFKSQVGPDITFSKNGLSGLNAVISESAVINPDKWFSGWTGEQIKEYADSGSLKTLFLASDDVVAIPVSFNWNGGGAGAGQFGSNVQFSQISPVPEPTSGLLIVLGLAGLALKRKRVA